LQALAGAADIDLKIDVQSLLPKVSVDRLRIQLVIFSLVQNALAASAHARTRIPAAPEPDGFDAAGDLHYWSDVPLAAQAMKEGAFEFVQKPCRDQDLLDRVNRALHLDTENRGTLALRADLSAQFDSLTPREKRVMQFVVDGAANKVIAIDLGLSERTMEIHRVKVMEKMEPRFVAHLVRMQTSIPTNPKSDPQWRAPQQRAVPALVFAPE
jgi:DNA-binding CsgD family transcriptional regulator